MLENTQEKSPLCVQCVRKPSLLPAVLTNIERIIEKSTQIPLPPRLLLQQARIRNFPTFGICCINYMNGNTCTCYCSLNLIQIQGHSYKFDFCPWVFSKHLSTVTKQLTGITSVGHYPLQVALGGTGPLSNLKIKLNFWFFSGFGTFSVKNVFQKCLWFVQTLLMTLF